MIRLRTILLFVTMLMAYHFALAQNDKNAPVIFSYDAGILSVNKSKIKDRDASLLPAYEQLLKDADKALNFKPVSVMEKMNIPPSGDKHDYMSLAPYYWPDPSKPGGIPYIRKDGETNPEVKEYKDKEYLPKLCEAVNTLGLAFYFSNDNKYADHAGQLIRVWFLVNQPHNPWTRGNTAPYDPYKLTIAPYMVDTKETRETLIKYYAEITYADRLVGYCMNMVD